MRPTRFLAFLLLAGCGHTHRLIEQRPAAHGFTKGPVTAEPLIFAFMPPAEWEELAQWERYVGDTSRAFAKALEQELGRTLVWAEEGKLVEQGVVVRVAIYDIVRASKETQGLDLLRADVNVLDPLTGESLYDGKIEGTSKGEGADDFAGHLGVAARNLAHATALILRQGRL